MSKHTKWKLKEITLPGNTEMRREYVTMLLRNGETVSGHIPEHGNEICNNLNMHEEFVEMLKDVELFILAIKHHGFDVCTQAQGKALLDKARDLLKQAKGK